jgi:MFS family permease
MTPQAGNRAAWYMVGLLLMAYLLSFIDRQIIAMLVTPIRRDFDITDFQFSLLHGLAFSLLFAVVGLPLAELADRYTRKWLVAGGVLLWSLMTFASGYAHNFEQLFLARVGVGIGEAALAPAAYSMVADAFERGTVPKAMAGFSVGSTVGTGLAFAVGGVLLQFLSAAQLPAWLALDHQPWQLAFFVVGLPGIVLALLIAGVREPPRQLRVEPARRQGFKEAWRQWCRLLGTYLPLFMGMAAMTAISSGFIFWYPSYLMRVLQFDVGSAGKWFGGLFIVCASVGVITGGWLASYCDRRGFSDSYLRVILCAVAGALLPYVLATRCSVPALSLVLMALAVFCTQMLAAVSVTAVQIITPNRLRAKLSSVYLLFVNLLGITFGAPTVAWLSDHWLGGGAAIGTAISWAAALYVPLALGCFYWARKGFIEAPRYL